MEEVKILKVSYKKISKTLVIMRALFLLPLFLLSLLIYIVGLILTLTIVGAIVGLPIILSTYVFDVLLISYIINSFARVKKINCPSCKRGRFIVTDIMSVFVCKGCSGFVKIEKRRPKVALKSFLNML